MGLPNLVTLARILLVPVFLGFAFARSTAGALAALAVFVIASASDRLDGHLARRSARVTRAGEFLDPLADKLLIGAALVALVATRGFPLWAALVIAFRELAVQLLRIQIVRGGGNLPASQAAKAKTVVQIVMVSWWLLPWEDANAGHALLLAAALLTTLTSGYEYFRKAQEVEEVAP